MAEKGLLTRDQEKFFGKLIVDGLELKGLPGLAARFGIPILIKTVDDNYGDKIEDPWRGYLTQLITKLQLALEDGVLTEEELDDLLNLAAEILNAEIDIPLLDETSELIIFTQTLKLIAAFIFKLGDEVKVIES